jgi:2-methylcitrate dehydratase PrpD
MSNHQQSATQSDERAVGPTTGKLVDRLLNISFNDLSDAAVESARVFLADTLLVGVAGSCNYASEKVLMAARKWDGRQFGKCRVLGRPGVYLSAHSAAVVNGFQIHCLEWDGLHEPSVVIALCVSTAAILSESEEHDFTLDEILMALTIGVETAVFFGAAAKTEPRFFRPSTAGLMGAAMAIGRLRGFNRQQLTDLLGCAYSQVSGTMQAHWEGSDALPLQVGIAARAALTAADLVEAGISGPHDVVDGKFGYFKLIETTDGLDPYLEAWGAPWKITEVAHKPFPAGRATQAALTAIRNFKQEHQFGMDDVESLTARVPSLIMLLVGRDWRADMPAAYARLCLQFVAPLMIREGLVDPREFTEERFASSRTQSDAAMVHVELDDNPNPNALGPQVITIKLKDGRILHQSIAVPFGSPRLPMSRADQLGKGAFCCEVAGLDDCTADLYAAVWQSQPFPGMHEVTGYVFEQRGQK